MRPIDIKKYIERHQRMLKAQERNGGFPLTIRELCKLFGLSEVSTGSVKQHTLENMIKLGMVIKKKNGHNYLAIQE